MVASDPQGSSADVTDEVEEDAATIGDFAGESAGMARTKQRTVVSFSPCSRSVGRHDPNRMS